MTPTQRKTAIQNIQNQLKDWASQQGIDMSLIPFMGRFGTGVMMNHGKRKTSTSSPTSSSTS